MLRSQRPARTSQFLRAGAAKPGLFSWTGACDENVYQPSGALLPIMAGAHMGDANHRSKQVGGVQIASHVAAPLRAFHQLLHRSLYQAARVFIESGSASDDAVESGRNDLLRGNVIDQQQHPGSQGFDRGQRRGEAAARRGQPFHLTPVDRLNQRVPRREMAI